MFWLAVAGAAAACSCALACAIVAAWLARERRRPDPGATMPRRAPTQPPLVVVPAPQQAPSPVFVLPAPVFHPVPAPAAAPAAAPAVHADTGRGGVVLQGRYPQLGRALGGWLQAERDEVERVRIAHDLGSVGGADAARALLDGVRTGALTPTVAADNLERGGFEAGIAVAAALRDPEPRVRALASTLVGRSTPLERMPLPSPPEPPASGAAPDTP